jgi:hypothetical protein
MVPQSRRRVPNALGALGAMSLNSAGPVRVSPSGTLVAGGDTVLSGSSGLGETVRSDRCPESGGRPKRGAFAFTLVGRLPGPLICLRNGGKKPL